MGIAAEYFVAIYFTRRRVLFYKSLKLLPGSYVCNSNNMDACFEIKTQAP